MIPGYQAPSGTIIVEAEAKPPVREERVAIYARVSEASHREHLERQVERLTQYCTVRGFQVAQVVREIASGVNDSRPKLLALLKDRQTTRIVVEHQDRLTRFGFRYLETLLELQGRAIEVESAGGKRQKGLSRYCVRVHRPSLRRAESQAQDGAHRPGIAGGKP